MSKRTSPGNVTLTLDMPIEVAEWLAANAERLGHQAHIASTKARRKSEETERKADEYLQQRQDYFANLGRNGYRELRKAGVSKNFIKNRDATKTIAPQLGVTWQALELAVTRFKRNLDAQLRKRRGREIARMYWAGFRDQEIADRMGVHRNTVINHIREVIKPTGRRA